MAGTKIRGITIQLGADYTKVTEAFNKVSKELSGVDRSLKDVNKLLKLDPKNVELLSQKQGYLKEAIDLTTQKLAEEKKILSEIQEIVGDEEDDLQIHQNNYLNVAYYTGKQWLTLDPQTNQIMEAPQDPHKARITVNRIKPVVSANLGKLTKNKPIMTVVPASTEQEDERKTITVIKHKKGCSRTEQPFVLYLIY